MEIPSDGEAAEVPDQHNIQDLIADAIVVLQIDGCAWKIFGDTQDLNLAIKCSYNRDTSGISRPPR
jgi:hypothetical protein